MGKPDSYINEIIKKRRSSFFKSSEILNKLNSPTRYRVIIADSSNNNRNILRNLVEEIKTEMNLNFDILEAKDGLDTLNYVIDDNKKFSNIKIIFTEEIMTYINGSNTVMFLKELIEE